METSLPAVNGSTNTVVVVRVRPYGRKETPTTPCAEAWEDGRSLIARRDERRGAGREEDDLAAGDHGAPNACGG